MSSNIPANGLVINYLNEYNEKKTWGTIEQFLNVDAVTCLTNVSMALKVIANCGITQREDVDQEIITNYATGLSRDTVTLSNKLNELRVKYQAESPRYKNMERNNLDEYGDVNMFKISMNAEMAEWTEQYEDTVLPNLNNLIQYVNSHIDQAINVSTVK